MANGDLHLLGTLYEGTTKKLNPTRPWRSNQTPPGGSGNGNVPNRGSGAITIKNSDSNDSYKIRWREVTGNGKRYLVCDRSILNFVTWDDLKINGFCESDGMDIILDGEEFKVRLLTVAEWNNIILNQGNYPELPTPISSDKDNSVTAADLTGAHNQTWNWVYNASWTNNAYSSTGGDGAHWRGRDSASYANTNYTNLSYVYLGFRPVLIQDSLPPVISGVDTDLGALTSSFSSQSYTITDDDEEFTVTEKLRQVGGTKEIILRTYAATSGVEETLSVSAADWQRVLNGDWEAVIIADDGEYQPERVFSFTKDVDTVELRRNTPLVADDMIAKGNMRIAGTFPEGVIWDFIRVCNNGNDANPTWEDVTALVLAGKNFPISNTMKTAADWGFNFWIKFRRGTAAVNAAQVKLISGTFAGVGGSQSPSED